MTKSMITPINEYLKSHNNRGIKSNVKRRLNQQIDRSHDRSEPLKKRYYNKMYNARGRNIEFSIPFEEIIFPERCPVFDIPLDYSGSGWGAPDSPTFDRIDPTKGYVSGNVKIISRRANRIKNDASIEDIKKILKYMEVND